MGSSGQLLRGCLLQSAHWLQTTRVCSRCPVRATVVTYSSASWTARSADRPRRASSRRRDSATSLPGQASPQQSQRPQQQQYSHQYMVTCHPGLEEVAAQELQQEHIRARAVNVIGPGRVAFSGHDLEVGYRAALWLRTGIRVLHQLASQQLNPSAAAGDTVYEFTREAVDWSDLLGSGQTLAVSSQVWGNSNVTNSQLVSRRVRDAVCDSVRDARGTRPPPPMDAPPNLPLFISLLKDTAVLYRDLGGGSLHRRGYKGDAAMHKAALNEAAAAGLLLLAGWEEHAEAGGAVLADPMCGSASLLIEAALIATHTAPGLIRHALLPPSASPWPFTCWPGHQQHTWRQLLEEARGESQLSVESLGARGSSRGSRNGAVGRDRGQKVRIFGNDIHQGALRLAASGAAAAGVSHLIDFHNGPAAAWHPPAVPTMVVVNPPWGLRLLQKGEEAGRGNSRPAGGSRDRSRQMSSRGEEVEGDDEHGLQEAWGELSHFLKAECPGCTAWVLSGNPDTAGYIRMRSSRKKSITIGGVKTSWLKYEVRRSQEQQQ